MKKLQAVLLAIIFTFSAMSQDFGDVIEQGECTSDDWVDVYVWIPGVGNVTIAQIECDGTINYF